MDSSFITFELTEIVDLRYANYLMTYVCFVLFCYFALDKIKDIGVYFDAKLDFRDHMHKK